MLFTPLALLGLGALSLAAPADPPTDLNNDGQPDHVIFEVTSVSKATSSVTVPLGGNVVVQENVTAIAVSEIEVVQVGRARCTIATAESEADVTDTVLVGWHAVFQTETKASSEVRSISCTYCEGDSKRHRGPQKHRPTHWDWRNGWKRGYSHYGQ